MLLPSTTKIDSELEAETTGDFRLVGRLQVMECRLKELIEAQRVLGYIMKLAEGYTMNSKLSLGSTVGERRMKECEVRG
jgi:hypothetical protein